MKEIKDLREILREVEQDPEHVLSNGAHVEIKTRKDMSGSRVISEMKVSFPRNREIPLGGITARVLREIPLDYLLHEFRPPEQTLRLNRDEERHLLALLKNYPSSPGRVPVPPIYSAAVAYFYEKFTNEKPYQPNVALSNVLETPVRTIATRIQTARRNGFLESGQTPRRGGKARGGVTAMAKDEILRWLGMNNFQDGLDK